MSVSGFQLSAFALHSASWVPWPLSNKNGERTTGVAFGVSLSLSFLYSKMGIILVSSSQGSDRGHENFVSGF